MPRPIAIDPDDFLDLCRLEPISQEEGKAAWEKAYAALETALADTGSHGELFVVVGIQAGGKSTWVKKMLLTAGERKVFFSGPLPSRKHRKRVIDIARRAGCRVVAVWVQTPLLEALKRNAARQGLTRVPEHVIHHVHECLEVPSLGEGFHEVLVISGLADDDHLSNSFS
jgi:predicted kinase